MPGSSSSAACHLAQALGPVARPVVLKGSRPAGSGSGRAAGAHGPFLLPAGPPCTGKSTTPGCGKHCAPTSKTWTAISSMRGLRPPETRRGCDGNRNRRNRHSLFVVQAAGSQPSGSHPGHRRLRLRDRAHSHPVRVFRPPDLVGAAEGAGPPRAPGSRAPVGPGRPEPVAAGFDAPRARSQPEMARSLDGASRNWEKNSLASTPPVACHSARAASTIGSSSPCS